NIDDEDALCFDLCPDLDGDGYFDAACGGSDCDDTDPNVHPGAFEHCSDGIDNSCNGLIDEADTLSCPVDCPDADGDGYRDAACGGRDCDDTNAAIYPGATEVCDGVDN